MITSYYRTRIELCLQPCKAAITSYIA